MTNDVFVALNLFGVFLNSVVAGINIFNFIRFDKPVFMVITIFNVALIAIAGANLLGAFGPHS